MEQGGYPHATHPASAATAGQHSTGMAHNGAGYVQPPQDIHQTTTASAATAGHQAGGLHSVAGEQYVAHTEATYAISQKKLSIKDGDWSIVDMHGNSSFKVSGRVASMRDTRVLKDAAGNKILTMKKKLITMHDSWEILAGDSSTVLATCKKSSLVQVKTAMDVMLAASTTGKKTPDYQVKGDFFDYNIAVFRGTEQVAVVTRQLHVKHAIMDKDSFGVTIYPGTDQALIFALIVIMDEIFLDGDSSDSD